MKVKDLSNMVFGDLTVIERAKREIRNIYFVCRCICGKTKEVRRDHLLTRKITNCGCRHSEIMSLSSIKHNLSGNKLYFIWAGMMNRCYNEKFQDYHNYGGRGIKVDEHWHSVKNFIDDVQDGYIKGLQLDRVENDMNYSKSNFRWATRTENNRNKRTNVFITIGNLRLTAIEWSEKTGIVYTTILGRIKRGKTGYDLLK